MVAINERNTFANLILKIYEFQTPHVKDRVFISAYVPALVSHQMVPAPRAE
jgi:hypothetical protein